ncbi:MAG: tetratricopeptide repeat protein, partial [Raineya sp.]
TYLRLAEIHFDKLRQYEEAKAYYDSTMALLPKDEEGYEKIAKRHEVLDEFIKYLKVVQLEDSLQRMAKMSENDLEAYLTENISRQVRTEKERQKAIEKAKRKAEAQKDAPKGTLEEEKSRQNSEWYFDNPTQVEAGKREFRQKWGNRPLADNWRRIAGISSEIDENAPKEAPSAKEQAKEEQEQIQTEVANRKRAVKVQIPYSQEQRQKSLEKWENASFNLAKLYHFQLEEYADAENTYWEIINRINKSQYEPEVYYLLYVLYNFQKNTSKAQEVRNLLQNKFPNSVYAKLIDNPNYLIENQAKDEAAQIEYAQIYESLFEQKKYKETIEALEKLRSTYPQNTIPDKIEALRVICLGRMSKNEKEKEQFDLALEEFFRKFPDSKLSETLKNMNQNREQNKP